jgi:hypothetical protein
MKFFCRVLAPSALRTLAKRGVLPSLPLRQRSKVRAGRMGAFWIHTPSTSAQIQER